MNLPPIPNLRVVDLNTLECIVRGQWDGVAGVSLTVETQEVDMAGQPVGPKQSQPLNI